MMKHIKFSIFIIILLFWQCTFDCGGDWKKKANDVYLEYKNLYELHTKDFENIAKILNLELEQVDTLHIDKLNKKLNWDVDSLAAFGNNQTKELAVFFRKFKLKSAWIVDKNTIYFDLANLEKYNKNRKCPFFDSVVVYSKNGMKNRNKSLNFQHQQIDKCWYIESSMSSL